MPAKIIPVLTDPACLCGVAIVGTITNGFHHGRYRCWAIGNQGRDEPEWHSPSKEAFEKRIADRIDGHDRDD